MPQPQPSGQQDQPESEEDRNVIDSRDKFQTSKSVIWHTGTTLDKEDKDSSERVRVRMSYPQEMRAWEEKVAASPKVPNVQTPNQAHRAAAHEGWKKLSKETPGKNDGDLIPGLQETRDWIHAVEERRRREQARKAYDITKGHIGKVKDDLNEYWTSGYYDQFKDEYRALEKNIEYHRNKGVKDEEWPLNKFIAVKNSFKGNMKMLD